MAAHEQESSHHRGSIIDEWLERADSLIYMLVAVLFLAAAVVMGGYTIIEFFQKADHDFAQDVIGFVNGLLLVLIILEVLGTVRHYLSTGAASLKPFLYIGIISATRRILAIGALSTLEAETTDMVFRQRMIDLGINGAVVLALAVALYLFHRDAGKEENEVG